MSTFLAEILHSYLAGQLYQNEGVAYDKLSTLNFAIGLPGTLMSLIVDLCE